MIATGFTRDDCLVGRRRVSYDKLRREYICNDCSGALVLMAPNDQIDQWHVECGRCGGLDFIHTAEARRQEAEAADVIAGLPDDMREALGLTPRRAPVLGLDEFNRLVHPEPVDL